MGFNPSLHPRDARGKFAGAGGRGKAGLALSSTKQHRGQPHKKIKVATSAKTGKQVKVAVAEDKSNGLASILSRSSNPAHNRLAAKLRH